MLMDGVTLAPGSQISNSHFESGTVFPESPIAGRIFFLTQVSGDDQPGLYTFDGTTWLTGDVNAVTAGTGLTGGGDNGAVTLAVDTDIIATKTYADSVATVTSEKVTTALGFTPASTGSNNFTGDQDLSNHKLTGIKTAGLNAEYDNGNSGSAITITLANGAKQKVVLNAATPTITISTTGLLPGNYQLRIIQDATGSRVPTFSGLSSSRWIGSASTPSINSAANGETIVNMSFDGTNITQSMGKVGAV